MCDENDALARQKRQLRQRLAAVRADVCERKKKDKLILDRVVRLIGSLGCKRIFTYVSMGGEVDTRRMIAEIFDKVEVYVPQTDADGGMTARRLLSADKLCPDRLGNLAARQLGDSCECDLAIVPLLGFNDRLCRIGYGKGCYDKYLSGRKTFSAGLAYDEQQVRFSEQPHDIPLDTIITPSRVLRRD